RLVDAAASGDAITMKALHEHDPAVLHGTTPQWNTCLHISTIHGHVGFCRDALDLNPSLLSAWRPYHTLASIFLSRCSDLHLREAILIRDKRGYNALHHAIHSGQRKLALELIEAEPALSRAVNQYKESPMFIAVMRNYVDIFERLLEIPDSAHGGPTSYNALHAAVRNGNSAIAKKIMETRPELVREEDDSKNTPIQMAVLWDKIDVLTVMLQHDRSLGYMVNSGGFPLIVSAGFRGNVDVARELLKYCPDAPSCTQEGLTCLHQAVWGEHTEFVKFVLDSSQLHRLVNTRTIDGDTLLHLAVRKRNPEMVAALLLHQDTDVTLLNNDDASQAKTLNWNEVSMLMLKYDPQYASSIRTFYGYVKDKVTRSSRMDIKSLTQTYRSNTSLVAILIATITFAAALTLPGGYSTDAGNEGHPIMARKFAFQAFLISDTLAMCSSLAVAFICIIARWEDLEFLLHYRYVTKKLMWFAYMATTTAFATGLYTVLAPRLLWLAITICILMSLLPILTKLLGEWPILKLRFRLGQNFESQPLEMMV
ncbi:hypothetical protein BS78_05G250600, partial [Paspalum vaginatum]